jgi:hypothetical protein
VDVRGFWPLQPHSSAVCSPYLWLLPSWDQPAAAWKYLKDILKYWTCVNFSSLSSFRIQYV